MKILITCAAGFIGMQTCLRLLAQGDQALDFIDSVPKTARAWRRCSQARSPNASSIWQYKLE